MRVIFDAGRQRWKIWFVVLISLATGGALVVLGGWMIQSYGLHPAEGGVLKPLATRLLLGLGFGGSGLAIIAGILLYLQCYVFRIEGDEDTGEFRVALAGLRLTIRAEEVVRAGFNDGVAHAGGISVNAPWYSVRLRGRRLPLIIDLQGDFLDERAVDRLLKGEPAAAFRP